MNNLLQKDKPVYHRFIDNQVLTDDQLNAVLDHLNYQDKITRTKLVGVGIVCGLEISYVGNNIHLSGGTAVTTDGELIVVKEATYTAYKSFADENVKYDHFLIDDNTIPLYELKEDASATDVKDLGGFEGDTGITKNDTVGIVYVECYEKEPEDCSPLECNAQGREVVKNLRVLISTSKDAGQIVLKDSILKGVLDGGLSSVVENLQKSFAKRVILNSGNTTSLTQLKASFNTDFAEITNSILKLSQINLFKDEFSQVNFDIGQKLKNIKQSDYSFLYIYDFYKDLVEASNELLSCLKKNFSICCPDPTAFPYHVMLGEIQKRPIVFRHAFYPSPTHDHLETLDFLKLKYRRLVDMIDQFDASTKNDLRITPSNEKAVAFGDKALPAYYNLNKVGSEEKLIASWNPENDELVLNYFKKQYPTSDFEPLDYCIRNHDFYRVEGHIGKDINAELKNITNIRNTKGLAFDIMPIAIGANADENTIDYEKYNVFFEDLQIILQAWNEEMKCIVAGSTDFLSGFSIADAGVHLGYLDYIAVASEINTVVDNDSSLPDGTEVSASDTVSGLTLRTEERAMDLTASSISLSASVAGIETLSGAKSSKNLTQYASKSNGAIENLSQAENSTGSLWKDVIGVADNSSDIQIKFNDALQIQTADWAKELKYATVEAPSKILGTLKASEDNKLLSIDSFTEENLLNYINSLQAQCSTAKEEKKKLQSEFDKEGSSLKDQPYMEQYFFVMNNIISTCCYIERFKVLYEEIIARKAELLDSLVLKNFIQKHPGAEHKAGVPKGGTLILLYYSQAISPSKKTGATDLTTAVATAPVNIGSNFVFAESVSARSRIPTNFVSAPQSTIEFSGIAATAEIATGFTSIPRSENINDGTIVGDLYLPYICCSNTPAMSFVFPEQTIDLFIDKAYVCMETDADADVVLLAVTPSDATIVPTVNGNEVINTIIQKDGKQYFDPNLLAVEHYGKRILFTVNGQSVDASLIVYQKPTASFNLGVVTFSNNNTKATVPIQNTSVPIDGQTFSWNIDGDIFDKAADLFEHVFEVTPGGTFKFNIELTAENGSCTDVLTDVLEFEVPKIEGTDEEKCNELAVARIQNSFDTLAAMIKLNKPRLGVLPAFFQTEMVPIYELIFKDIEATLKGAFDDEICELLIGLIANLNQRLESFDGIEGQAFLICMHYEAIQLYFFIQRCREKNITSKQGITNSILKTTQTYLSVFKIAMEFIMKDKNLINSLQEIIEVMGDRMSNTLRKSIQDSIDLLKSSFA